MKVTIDIDCTPEEARTFLGLPDLAPVHAAYVEQLRSLVVDGLSPADVEKVIRAWMPAGMADGFEKWQQAFWSAASGKNQG